MAKQITFVVDDKEYILEFNRKTLKEAGEKGVTIDRLMAIETNPIDAVEIIPLLWSSAFDMHHPSVKEEKRQELFKLLNNKRGSEEDENDSGLFGALAELFAEPLNTLFEDEGNVEWKASWR